MVAAFTRYFLSLSFLVFYSALSFSQDQKTDTIRSRKDSLRNVALEKQSTELQQLKAAHEEDSLRKIQLQSELNSLKSTDNLKKSELLKQLTEIRTADSLRKAKQKKQIDSLKTFVKGFPVKPFLDTLFIVYSKQGSFTPAERAKAISERIVRLYEDFGFKPDSLQLNKSQTTVDLVYQDIIVTSVTEEDALWFNSTPIQLANKYKAVINKAVIDYRNETSWETLTKEIALSMLVIASWLVIVVLLSKLFRRLENKVKSLEGSVIKGIHIRRYELFDSKREVAVLINVLTALKWILILITIYVALPVIFRIFPWTHNFSETLISYATDPLKKIMHAVWAYLPNLITIIILIVVFRYVIRFFHFLKVEVERGALKIPGFYSDWANPTYQIIRILILAFMLIVIFPYMPGSDSPILRVYQFL
ncbi:hypothetical protein INP83_10675 [Mucilaginibacter sp. 21P]|uniref:hypothetical protein n=1 Tax=Mucilaginibacter sp. 21P TaxID=2778902 RepID=UPI001C5658D1|nr:hypothetical protein [Mucilaginibacter sp. 21P]QXV67519.1 hypothetical protein INP83_10675 [Mucilaginibacter sp. 21P]